MLASDGGFSVEGVSTQAVEIVTRGNGYCLATGRMPFQVLRSNCSAVYVDADRTDLETYLKPEPGNP